MRLRSDELWLGRLRNALQSALILAGLAGLAAVPAWLLAGPLGVVWALILAVVLGLAGTRVPARFVLARSGAWPLMPWQAPGLHELLAEIYRRAGLDLAPQLHWVPDGSLNAFAVGDRHDGGIAVTAGLLRTLDRRQLAGVLAHEVSHLRNGDTRVMAMAAMASELTAWGATLVQILLLLMLPFWLAGEVDLPWLALLLVAFAPTVSSLLQLALSRNREFAADIEAAALTGDPRGFASALATLERHQGAWLAAVFGQRDPLPLEWLRTHPTTAERIRRLLSLEADGYSRWR